MVTLNYNRLTSYYGNTSFLDAFYFFFIFMKRHCIMIKTINCDYTFMESQSSNPSFNKFLLFYYNECLPIHKWISFCFLIVLSYLSQQNSITHFLPSSSSLEFIFYSIASILFFIHKGILLLPYSLIFVYVVLVVVMFHMIFTWFSSCSRIYGFFCCCCW